MCLALGTVAAGDDPVPWIEIRAVPSPALVHRSGETADMIVDLEIVNLTERRLRVDRATVAFLEDDRTLRSVVLDPQFFDDPSYPRATRIDPGRRIGWDAICLDSVPPGADRLRFDLELTGSRQLGRSKASVEVGLEAGPSPVRLRLPFEGFWNVAQGHACSSQHRTGGFGGDFAWDFAAIGPGGPGNPSYEKSLRNEDAYGFGKPVLAPAAGRVVVVVDDVADNDGLESYPRRSLLDTLERPEWIFGNFVVIDIGRGVFVLLGHLRSGSVAVARDRIVREGEPIGECGNSGNTYAPHLHVQVMNRPDPTDPEVRGVPGLFVDYREFVVGDDGKVSAMSIEAGDPPQHGVVAPVPAPSN